MAHVPNAANQHAPHVMEDNSYIAEQFVRQYYLILQSSPWQLHHFYKENSLYTVQYTGSGHSQTVQGAKMIGQRIQETLPNAILPAVEGKEKSCEILNIRFMHQVSLPGSLVVAVSGNQVSPKNGQQHRFYQTFVLASEPGQANAYYVHNDMCSFEQEMPVMAPPAMGVTIPAANGSAVPMGVVPARGPQGLVPVSPPGSKPKPIPPPEPIEVNAEAPPTPEKESSSPKFGTMPDEPLIAPAQLDIGKPTIPSSATPVQQNPTADPTEDDEPQELDAAEEEADEEAEDFQVEDQKADEEEKLKADASGAPSQMSWAARAAMAAKTTAKPAPPKPTQKPAAPPVVKEAEAEATPAPRKERVPYKPQDELDASVFVSGVPNTCDEDKLKELFGKHGEVVKVSLKAEKHFAIIDFNSSEAAVEALKVPAIKCDSSIMKVEARRKPGGAVKPGRHGKGESRAGGERGKGRGRDSGSKGGSRRGPREAH